MPLALDPAPDAVKRLARQDGHGNPYGVEWPVALIFSSTGQVFSAVASPQRNALRLATAMSRHYATFSP